jgi:hypothetical protein
MPIYQQKLEEWVQIFKDHIQKVGPETHVTDEEGYKFHTVDHFLNHFDIEAFDLAAMLDVAIPNNNLVVGSMYYPKKMLLIFAREKGEEVRAILKNLFDESKSVSERLTESESAFNDIQDRWNIEKNETAHSYHSLRFLSLLLALRYPDKYNPLKPSEWRVFVKFLEDDFRMPKRLTAGEQYELYTPYIEALRAYIQTQPSIQELKHKLTAGLSFNDDESRWMTQNIIYVTARAYAERMAESSVRVEKEVYTAEENQEVLVEESDTGFFAYEAHLEQYIVKNWNKINFGEELRIFIDDGGSEGEQYTTDVGIIDILALDKDDNYVVIELKRAESGYKVVGQVLNYMGWVREKMAEEEGKTVRGMIVVGKADKTLRSALKPVSDIISLKEYRTQLDLVDPT